ncbi:unnamed protein product [Acanthoscelides obtectus]|uniref:DNA polymerase alpha subunit B n=1 Tax=Acanthoscelides obtectus TaxID=200917 RepID=A0A9P0KGF8_ACAOB|nr:unnamed protein product [Acanthoscelides obtectus]CAK1660910.1 DNA polymerase alpha subunit B [Acanthoscelides obtectus]
MYTTKDIASQFSQFNITVEEKVLEKCLELCARYNIEPEDLCDQWYAFAATNLNGAEPTLPHLEKLERNVLEKEKRNAGSHVTIATPKRQETIATPKRQETSDVQPEVQSVISSYASVTPKAHRIQSTKHISSPKTPVAAKNISVDYEKASPSVSMSDHYSQRTDSRKVQASYGSPTAQFKREEGLQITIKNFSDNAMPADAKLMYEVLSRKALSLSSTIDYFGKEILKHQGMMLSEGVLTNLRGDVVTYGRIISDTAGKMNAQSVLLEGTADTNLCNTTNLNLSKMNKYSLFPGQSVAVKGNKVTANDLVVEEIYSSVPLSLPEETPVADGPLEIVVSAGPYTFSENLSYEPLHDLLKYIEEYRPHVWIMLGPFLDVTHDSVKNGDILQSYRSFFEGLIENIANTVQLSSTQLVIVSSHKDVHHRPVYPTPPYKVKDNHPNIKFVSDPAMININGLVIGITSVDVLLHLSNYELYYDKISQTAPDRLGRLVSHLLKQHNFYPLYPPVKGLGVDHELFEQYGMIDTKPHVFITPSNLKHFVKNIDDCLVINPERLVKGHIGGTYARIEVIAGSSKSVCNRASCQVLRI